MKMIFLVCTLIIALNQNVLSQSKTNQASKEAVYYQYDGLGSVAGLTDTNGNVVEKCIYDVFGKPTIKDASESVITKSAFNNRFMFTGRENIQELTIYGYRNRMYSAEIGKFLQTDALKFESGDYNLYRYVGNNSINAADPTGLANLNLTASGNTPSKNVMLPFSITSEQREHQFGDKFNPEGGFSVMGQGSMQSGIYDDRMAGGSTEGTLINAQQLADIITSPYSGYEAGTPIILGTCDPFDNGLAQELANILGVPVYVPNGFLMEDDPDNPSIFLPNSDKDPDPSKPGKWIRKDPNNIMACQK